MNETYLIYIGQGASLFGVPARNLTEDEAFIHGEQRLITSGLYKLAKPREYAKYRKNKYTLKETTKENDNG